MLIRYLFFLLVLISLSLTGCNSSSSSSSSGTTQIRYSLSGHILVAGNTAKDSDVNDVRVPDSLENDSIYTAQFVHNPLILGGYVNQPWSGPSGRSQTYGDINDFFEVDLRANQIITLFVANENLVGNDLDLALLDRNGAILNASVGEGKTESLIVPTDGRYFVLVQAHSGASNYALTIGQEMTTTSRSMQLTDDFVPNEIIIKFSQDKLYQGTLATLGMQTQSTDPKRRMLYSIKKPLKSLGTSLASQMAFATPELQAKYETLLAIKALRQRPDITEASPNYRWKAFREPNDTFYHYQWNHSLMSLPQAWDTTIGDAQVIVAVVDTGVLLQHPDLRNQLVQGYDFIASRYTELDSDRGIDPDPNDPGDQFPGGSTFHGTHVAGTVAAQSNNSEGVAGVAWLTKIMPLRVLGKGGMGIDYDTEQAIRFAAGLPNDSGTVPTRRADIINLSLGGPDYSPGFQDLMNEVRDVGVIVVAASGNEDTSTPSYPAALANVVSVGAVNINKQRASYSNFGTDLDVMAPGGDNTPDTDGDGMPDSILSTMGTEKPGSRSSLEFSYDYAMGTSMASPQVAGVISLMKGVNPSLTPQDFDELLKSGKITDDLGPPGRDDTFGYGLINAQKAVLAAAELTGGEAPEPLPPFLLVNPKSLNFGLNSTTAVLTLSNGGNGDLLIESITEDSGGFLSIDISSANEYIIKIDRSRLTQGTFSATISIISNVNTVTIPVILQVSEFGVNGDAGFHYILLVEPGTLETVQEIRTSAINGVYAFRFDNVPEGTYIIAAGSDFNNDGFICDVGEACGAFSTVERPISIELNRHRSEIDFNTGFNVNFLSQSIQQADDIQRPARGFARLKQEAHRLAQ